MLKAVQNFRRLYSTRVHLSASRHETEQRTDFISKYEISYGEKDEAGKHELRDFAILRRGMARGFRFLAPDDHRIVCLVPGTAQGGGTLANHGKAAVMGFCMGGALTLAAAVHLPTASGAGCLYGVPPPALADPRKLQVPLQWHFAEHDDWCTPEGVRSLEEQLQHLTIEHELHRYDAHHAFFNEARPEVHNPEAAALSWRRSLAFLARHLGA